MEILILIMAAKTFSLWAYVSSITHILYGLILTVIAIVVSTEEGEKFTCNVAPKSTVAQKIYVDQVCYSRYQQNYNSPLPFYWFVILSIWSPMIVAVVYSLSVRRRVEEIDSSNEQQTEGEAENLLQNSTLRRTWYVFYFYFSHLAIRAISGILFTILQHTVVFPSDFDFEFSCSLPQTVFATSEVKNASAASPFNNSTFIACENATASEKHLMSVIVSVLNTGFALIMLMEMIYLCRRFPNCVYTVSWSCDAEFITVYLLRKQYMPFEFVELLELELVNVPKCININRQNTSWDNLFISLGIYTERAKHKFSKTMQRHEIYDVYTKVPQHSVRLEEVKDLFYPDQDTKGNFPRTILAVGRPGIGKTVLTEKIIRDCVNEVDEFYCAKSTFYFKIRGFNHNALKDITLKTFLRYGTDLSEEEFESIYEHITKNPEKAILIFDGLDEFNGNVDCLDLLPNDPNIRMPGISWFIKLIFGHVLQEATVLVTSRPTANELYSRLPFDRAVEIIGFSSDNIEEYVSKFCDNHNRSDLKPKIWNHIKSSSNLLSMCYIPVNCFIVSTILFECFSDDTGILPPTLTELYRTVIEHFEKRHSGNLDGQSFAEASKKLQLLAYNGIACRQPVFDYELFDEHMRKSGLLNSFANPYSQLQTQFCFIHLTIQEFLAARHVTEVFNREEIKEFITSHISESGNKWRLVLQFIAGLLGKKWIKENGYKDCVLAFAGSFLADDGELSLDLTDNTSSLFAMKCQFLREVDDEDIIKEVCETTALNDVVSLSYTTYSTVLTSSEWAAVTFVCKHMKKLTRLDLDLSKSSEECYQEVYKLLQTRCIKQLKLVGSSHRGDEVKRLCQTLITSNCTLNHQHSKLTEFKIQRLHVTDDSLSTMYEFFKGGHAACLEKLVLLECGISSRGLSLFCEFLHKERIPELRYLELTNNAILDEDVTVLFNTVRQEMFALTQLTLAYCSLTDQCIPSLCDLLKDERCNLTVLSLEGNDGVSDEGLRMLCESALTSEHCNLAELCLAKCSLTDESVPKLCKALQDERCKLTVLSLEFNKNIRDGSLRTLCESVLTNDCCKLSKLRLSNCSLTDDCIPVVREALQDEHCVLTELRLNGNKFTDGGKKSLSEIETRVNIVH